MNVRVVFMGTPEFAVPTLRALDDYQHVVGVVTQPDRKSGRGRRLSVSPVKQKALSRGLEVFQPETLRSAEAVEQLSTWQPDLIVVAAFGQILRAPVLELPPFGCLNVHASLLPRYRGASPVSAAIRAGDPTTGVTIMCMDRGLDTGPMLAQAELPIASGDTTASLTRKLGELGAQLLIETLPTWVGSTLSARPQDDSLATYCRPLTKADGRLDWTQTAMSLDRAVRANDPWPGAYTTWRGQRLKILRAQPRPDWSGEGLPGQAVALDPGLGIVTGQGLLELIEVQLAGRKALLADLFVRGQHDLIGEFLGA